MGRPPKIDTDKQELPETIYECKDCGSEISKARYSSHNGLCSECERELFEEFSNQDDN